MNEINYGYIPSDLRPTDYIKGVSSPLTPDVHFPEGVKPYLPDFSPQSNGKMETNGCVTWTALQDIEVQFNKLYQLNLMGSGLRNFLESNSFVINGKIVFSKKYIAKLSGTDKLGGNTFQNVADAIRQYGLIPESMYPFTPNDTFQTFYQPVAQNLLDFGQKIFDYVDLGYHFITDNNYQSHLIDGGIQIAIGLCPGYGTGNITATCGLPEQHSVLIDEVDPTYIECFDHYLPMFKKLALNYNIPAQMQYVVNFKELNMGQFKTQNYKGELRIVLEADSEVTWEALCKVYGIDPKQIDETIS